MKRIVAVFAFALVASFVAAAADRPDFVKTELASFNKNDYYRDRAAWARPFGWGTGVYHLAEGHDIPFSWFTWCNTDGDFQMTISTQVYAFDLRKIRALKDIINRPYNASSTKDSTYVEFSNDWFMDDKGMPFCKVVPVIKSSHNWDCDNPGILRYYLNRVSGAVPQLRFDVKEDMQ